MIKKLNIKGYLFKYKRNKKQKTKNKEQKTKNKDKRTEEEQETKLQQQQRTKKNKTNQQYHCLHLLDNFGAQGRNLGL